LAQIFPTVFEKLPQVLRGGFLVVVVVVAAAAAAEY